MDSTNVSNRSFASSWLSRRREPPSGILSIHEGVYKPIAENQPHTSIVGFFSGVFGLRICHTAIDFQGGAARGNFAEQFEFVVGGHQD